MNAHAPHTTSTSTDSSTASANNVVLVCGHTARTSAATGIQRVVRMVGRALQDADQLADCVSWHQPAKKFLPLAESEAIHLEACGGPTLKRAPNQRQQPTLKDPPDWIRWLPIPLLWRRAVRRQFRAHYAHQMQETLLQPGDWLLMPELTKAGEISAMVTNARANQMRLACIFYDALPVLHPEWYAPFIRESYERYMCELAEADIVFCISDDAAASLRKILNKNGLSSPQVARIELASTFSDTPRGTILHSLGDSSERRVAAIGTLEPRKNHETLLKAWELLLEREPQLDWHLTLVGRKAQGHEDLARRVEATVARLPSVTLLSNADDTTLERVYAESHFTVFPSLGEGFGIPIVESLWRGRPCLCANWGAMAEVASRNGGCLTANTRDARSLAKALQQLGTDEECYERLAQEARDARLDTWPHVANAILAKLREIAA